MKHYNGLLPAEAERLALLREECGEVQHAIGKILRHGWESTHPDGGPTNREALQCEIGHVYAAVELMTLCAQDLDFTAIGRSCGDKVEKVKKYLHYDVLQGR